MGHPTQRDVINHVAEHFGLTKQHAIEIMRTPTHPQSLRDEFAAKAMNGICASGPGHHMTDAKIAKEAYRLADAMLEARFTNH